MNLQRLQEIQEAVTWPVFGEIEKKNDIPDVRISHFVLTKNVEIVKFLSNLFFIDDLMWLKLIILILMCGLKFMNLMQEF